MAHAKNAGLRTDLSDRGARIKMGVILVLALAMRLFRLGSQSFWWDEVYSATLSAKNLATIIPRFGQTPTLYHVLLHFWMYLGRSDAIIRLLSVVFGVAAVWVMYRLATTLFDARHGLLCAFLLAISPFHIWYSQEARMYALLILLSMSSVLFFLKVLSEGGWKYPFWWAVTSVLAIYTHYYAVFILLFQMMFYIISWRRYRARRSRVIWACIIQILLVAPIFLLFFVDERYATIQAQGAGDNPLRFFSIPYTFFAFSLGFSYGPSIYELHWARNLSVVRPYAWQILPVFFLFAVVFILGLLSLRREREKMLFLLLYLLVPMTAASIVSLKWTQISYNVRYVCASLPAFYMILARGVLARRHTFVRRALFVLLLALTAVSIHHHYFWDKYAKEDHRSAARLITERSQKGDVVLTPQTVPFRYYYKGSLDVESLYWLPRFYPLMIKRRIRGHARAWVILSRDWGADPEGKMRGYFQQTFPAVMETTFSNLYLGLFKITPNENKTDATRFRRGG